MEVKYAESSGEKINHPKSDNYQWTENTGVLEECFIWNYGDAI